MIEAALIVAFVTIVGFFVNKGNQDAAMAENARLQEDAQDFNAVEADKERKWQEDFYNNYQSPEALFRQYSNMGVNTNAATMAALGVSPSVAQGATASSGANQGLGLGVNSVTDLINSMNGSLSNIVNSEKTSEETKWIAPVNDATINATLGQLELNWKKYGLDKDIYQNVTLPVAKATIDKTYTEIDEIKMKTDREFNEILQIQQNIRNLKAQERLTNTQVDETGAHADLLRMQTWTEGYKQMNLNANTRLTNAEALGQELENRLKTLDVNLSESLGINVHLDKYVLGAYGAAEAIGDLGEHVGNTFEFNDEKLTQIKNGIDRALQAVENTLKNKSIAKRAFNHVGKYFDEAYKGSDRWIRNRGKGLKALENWINSNTVYGM